MRRGFSRSRSGLYYNFFRKLGKSKYQKGVRVELKVFRILREHGFVVFRHPHSATPDLLAWRSGVLYLIEVKSTNKDVIIVDPEQVKCIMGMLEFFLHTAIPTMAFIVVYFTEHDEFGARRIRPVGEPYVMIRRGDHVPELPL